MFNCLAHRKIMLTSIMSAILCLMLFSACGCSASPSQSSTPSGTTSASPASESYPDVTIKEVDFTRDFVNGGNEGMSMYETSDGVVVYVLDLTADFIEPDQVASYEAVADAGLAYILENGYPNKTFTNNKGMDAYITQMAIWWYQSEDELSSRFKNASEEADEYGLSQKTKDLVEKARQANDENALPNNGKIALIYAVGDSSLARAVGLFDKA